MKSVQQWNLIENLSALRGGNAGSGENDNNSGGIPDHKG